MKISELLEAVEQPKSNLASAASLNDTPEVDDVDDAEVDDEDSGDEDSGDVDAFMNSAGSIGDDLYSLSQWNYSDEFNNIGPDTSVLATIESLKADYPQIANYISESDEYVVANDKRVCALIYVKSTDTFAVFTADRDGVRMRPSVSKLLSDDLIDQSQASRLQMIMNTGKKYSQIANASGSFDVGTSSGNSDFVPMLEALADSALKLPSVNTSKKVSAGDASVEFGLSDEDYEAKVLKRMAEKKAKKEAALKAYKG